MIRHPFDPDDVDIDSLKAALTSRLGRPVELLTSRKTSEEPGVLIIEDPDTGEHLDVDAAAVAAVVAAQQRPKGRMQLLLEEFDAAAPAARLAVFRKFLAQQVDDETAGRRRFLDLLDARIEQRIRERRNAG